MTVPVCTVCKKVCAHVQVKEYVMYRSRSMSCTGQGVCHVQVKEYVMYRSGSMSCTGQGVCHVQVREYVMYRSGSEFNCYCTSLFSSLRTEYSSPRWTRILIMKKQKANSPLEL